MASITGNRLLFLSLLGFVAYWVIGLSAPKPYIASLSSLLLLVLSGMMLWRWGPTAWRIVWGGQRSSDAGAEGSHLAVYGTTLVALGLHYGAWYRLIWIYFGAPTTWSNSAWSSAGVATAAVGLTLLYFSPDVSKTEMKTPNTIWLAIVVGIALVFAFFIGTKSVEIETRYSLAAALIPGCSADRQVIGSASKIYHEPGSPYRPFVHPVRCFKTRGEAVAAGFRAPS